MIGSMHCRLSKLCLWHSSSATLLKKKSRPCMTRCLCRHSWIVPVFLSGALLSVLLLSFWVGEHSQPAVTWLWARSQPVSASQQWRKKKCADEANRTVSWTLNERTPSGCSFVSRHSRSSQNGSTHREETLAGHHRAKWTPCSRRAGRSQGLHQEQSHEVPSRHCRSEPQAQVAALQGVVQISSPLESLHTVPQVPMIGPKMNTQLGLR